MYTRFNLKGWGGERPERSIHWNVMKNNTMQTPIGALGINLTAHNFVSLDSSANCGHFCLPRALLLRSLENIQRAQKETGPVFHKKKKQTLIQMKWTKKNYISVSLLCHMKPMLLLVSQRFFASNLQHRMRREITDPLWAGFSPVQVSGAVQCHTRQMWWQT